MLRGLGRHAYRTPVINPSLDLNFLTGTLSPLVTFTRSSSATYFNSSGVLTTAITNTPRFDYNPSTLAAQGLLIEESRTNSIRNNTMQGTVAGTPGTAPTNWSVQTSASGLTRTIVGTGTENGITYIDVKYAGTTTGAFSSAILANSEQATQIAAANGQNWTGSWYLSLSAGSLTGISLLNIQLTERDAAGLLLASSTANVLPTITSANLTTQRFVVSRTFNNASTAFVTCEVRFSVPISTAVDFTLRIGLPQLELGAFATSVIQTTNAAVTRNADVASINTLSPWFNATEGTLFAEGVGVNNVSAATRRYAQFDDAGPLERIIIGYAATNISRFLVQDGGVSTADITVSATTGGALAKIAGAYAANNFQQATNGTLGSADISGTLPTVTKLSIGADEAANANTIINGRLRRITYYPLRLSDAELQAITA